MALLYAGDIDSTKFWPLTLGDLRVIIEARLDEMYQDLGFFLFLVLLELNEVF